MYAYHAPSFVDLASNSNFVEFDSFSPAIKKKSVNIRCPYIGYSKKKYIYTFFYFLVLELHLCHFSTGSISTFWYHCLYSYQTCYAHIKS